MDDNIKCKVSEFRNSGFDEDSIRMATEDMENGVEYEKIDCYMNANIIPAHRIEIANLFRQGMPLDLGVRLGNLNKNQLEEVFPYARERIPFAAIREIIMQYSVPHQIKKAFELYKEGTKEYAKNLSLEQQTTNVDTQKPVTTEINHPTTVGADKKEDVLISQEPTDLSDSQSTTNVVEQPAPDSKELIKEIQKVFSDSTKTLVENINDRNAGIFADMITKFDDSIQAIVDEIRKDKNIPFPPEPVIQTETPEPAPVFQRAPETNRIRRPRPEYLEDAVSFTRMLLMPDGSLRPIEVERENPKKPKGLLGFASKLFGKDTYQESLLRQLINGRLSAPQLKQIQRAVKSAFSPLEIKDLIESDLDPEEMGNIIDVIIADRGQILEVV